MNGIILAGGYGKRLYPITMAVSKQLMPIFDKPMIYYPLSILMEAGIREILIITTKEDFHQFKSLLGDGSVIGCNFSYKIQEKPNGLAQAFIIGSDFIGKDKVALVLGDNIFYGSGFSKLVRSFSRIDGAAVFAYQVKNPELYGVVEFDSFFNAISIEEKPKNPKSNYAIPGLYFYDNQVLEIAKTIKPSKRGEYEITDLNNKYLSMGKLKVGLIDRGVAWLDTGTFDSLSDASEFVRVIEKRQGYKIGCIEEVAFRMGYINHKQLKSIAKNYTDSEYGKYLKNIQN